VRAPFDARVVNLHTAVGQFVAPGPAPVFSLVDARAWYVVANYRETDLARIAPGMDAEVYVLTDPRHRFHGKVQGIGWAVNPEDQPITPGLPKIERELNWVHIAQRFPVRILIEDPQPPDLFRVGASAVAIVRSRSSTRPADGAR
jgi:multidrug efflux system membrane fusion protein